MSSCQQDTGCISARRQGYSLQRNHIHPAGTSHNLSPDNWYTKNQNRYKKNSETTSSAGSSMSHQRTKQRTGSRQCRRGTAGTHRRSGRCYEGTQRTCCHFSGRSLWCMPYTSCAAATKSRSGPDTACRPSGSNRRWKLSQAGSCCISYYSRRCPARSREGSSSRQARRWPSSNSRHRKK